MEVVGPQEFKDQLERFRQFKRKLDKAGVEIGDKYEIPLAHRIGQFEIPKYTTAAVNRYPGH